MKKLKTITKEEFIKDKEKNELKEKYYDELVNKYVPIAMNKFVDRNIKRIVKRINNTYLYVDTNRFLITKKVLVKTRISRKELNQAGLRSIKFVVNSERLNKYLMPRLNELYDYLDFEIFYNSFEEKYYLNYCLKKEN